MKKSTFIVSHLTQQLKNTMDSILDGHAWKVAEIRLKLWHGYTPK